MSSGCLFLQPCDASPELIDRRKDPVSLRSERAISRFLLLNLGGKLTTHNAKLERWKVQGINGLLL
jgi:hypothetical protein